jgi:hypothetical protein
MPAALLGVAEAGANIGLNIANSGSQQLQPLAVTQLSPAEQQFFELQALDAESQATKDEATATQQYNTSATATNYVKYLAIGLSLFLVYKVFSKRGYFN